MAENGRVDRFWGLVECSDGTVITRRHYLNGYRSSIEVPLDSELTMEEKLKMDDYNSTTSESFDGSSISLD